MFDLPDAKRVCREDLNSPRSSRSPSPIPSETATHAANALQKAYGSLQVFTATDALPIDGTTSLEHMNRDDEEEHEFEFRLFRTPASNAHSGVTKATGSKKEESKNGDISEAQWVENEHTRQKVKIRLRSPSPAREGEGGFIVPFRRWEYYFSDPESVLRALSGGVGDSKHSLPTARPTHTNKDRIRQQYLEVAVSSDEILAAARSGIWPGCHLSWRVTSLTLPSAIAAKLLLHANPTSLATTTSPSSSKKKKPGKRKRIQTRKLAVAKGAAAEAEKEKRARRNREKKLKRRQKEKEKKASMRGAEGDNLVHADESMNIPGDDNE